MRLRRLGGAHAIVVAATIAILTTVVTTVVGIADSLQRRPPDGVQDAGSLTWVVGVGADGREDLLSYPDFADLADAVSGTADLSAYTSASLSLDVSDAAGRTVLAQFVSPGFLDLLGVRPALGSWQPHATDVAATSERVAISDRLWRSEFGADPTIVGRSTRLAGRLVTVAAVLPRRFVGLERLNSADVWADVRDWTLFRPAERGLVDARAQQRFRVVARRRAERSAAELEQRLLAAFTAVRSAHGAVPEALVTLRVTPLRGGVFPADQLMVAQLMFLLWVASGALAVSAGSTVVLLTLRRLAMRMHELAIRLALGALPRHLLRVFLADAALPFALGMAGGLVAGAGMFRLLLAATGLGWEGGVSRGLSGLGLLGLILPVITVLAIVLTVVVRAARRVDLARDLSHGASVAGDRAQRVLLARVVVGAQLTVAMAVLGPTTLAAHAAYVLRTASTGFAFLARTSVLEFEGSADSSATAASRLARWEKARSALPSALGTPYALAGGTPLRGRPRRVRVEGARDRTIVAVNAVSEGYVGTLGIRLVAGREFTAADVAAASRVALVSRALAARLWGPSPLGHTVRVGADGTVYEIIGVVEETQEAAQTAEPAPMLYVPLSADPVGGTATTVLLGTREPAAVVAAERALRAAWTAAPARVSALVDLDADRKRAVNGTATLVLFAAAGAVTLAGLGVFALVQRRVSERLREIGVRRALGARTVDILRLVAAEFAALVVVGAGLGALLSRAIVARLGGAFPGEPLGAATVLGVSAPMLLVLVFIAVAVPTWHALRVTPMQALRAA